MISCSVAIEYYVDGAMTLDTITVDEFMEGYRVGIALITPVTVFIVSNHFSQILCRCGGDVDVGMKQPS